MTTLSEFLTSLAAVLGSAGLLITAITGLLKVLHDIRARTKLEREPAETEKLEAPEIPTWVNGRKVNLWQTPSFVIGGTLLGLAVIAVVVVLVLNNVPRTIVPGPCPEGYDCLVQMSGGGKAFTWNQPPGEITAEYTSECAHSGSYGLRLVYSFSGNGNGGWGVHWANSPAKHLDASGHATLTFWVKGDKGGENVQVGLKDTNRVEHYVNVTDWGEVSTSYSMIAMQLDQFQSGDNAVNIASLENVSFGFNASHAAGSICIDDITFK